MNKGSNPWASKRDFQVGQRKRGNGRELVPFGMGTAEVSKMSLLEFPPYHGGYARIHHWKNQILIRLTRLDFSCCPEIELALILS